MTGFLPYWQFLGKIVQDMHTPLPIVMKTWNTERAILPYALAFAAGAMIFVVVEEVIPESQRGGNTHLATAGAMIGFTVMMILDVALG